ncbi:MAG: hypothetical protein H0W68_08375, partial [Gemmatimonadaceae bacterium]|nr:hypothetical protein [Gemmatimonadaceae bacterium]
MQPHRIVLILSVAAFVGCGGATPAPSPGPSPSPGSPPGAGMPAMPAPLVAGAWPIRTREHVDLWLHAYAMITPDTTLVPYFRRGYRDRMAGLRRVRGATSLLDANRDRLLARLAVQPSLATGGQFLPLYFESWDQMRQVIEIFVRGGGGANTNDPNLGAYLSILGGAFQSAADREWLRQFVEATDDENRKFYEAYWTSEVAARRAVIAATDSMWQRQWRPALQRYLNNTQQQNGELYLSLPLGGEGRTVQFGKQQNAVAVQMPDTRDNAEVALYVMAHE